jgi:asparagine synthase (glutamine-hydrolysing)
MCGITGFIPAEKLSKESINTIVLNMTNQIASRGPDSFGSWVDDQARIGLGHRRLAILDLSKAGHQPMESSCGRYILTFNGEIYNHLDIRKSLERKSHFLKWNGLSDTETLLKLIETYGPEKALNELTGMFAFGLWDKKNNQLFLARDRMGEKPLYFGWVNNSFVFASELKAIKAYPGFENPINSAALAKFMQLKYVPTPSSIYENIYKLEPGKYINVSLNNFQTKDIVSKTYWSLDDEIKNSKRYLLSRSQNTLEQFHNLLSSSINSQMISDVPLGAFLSGGIDSSLIVSLMQELSPHPIKTFTIGFNEGEFNEADYAKKVAAHIGTDHHELIVTPELAMDCIPLLPNIYDEPFADSSQIPTYLVSQFAKNHVSVVLSGDGGDELFAGYNRYLWAPQIWKKISKAPNLIQKILINLGCRLSSRKWNSLFKYMDVDQPGEKIHKVCNALKNSESFNLFFLNLIAEQNPYENLLTNSSSTHNLFQDTPMLDNKLNLSNLENMMRIDSLNYLPDDILCKVDRAAMSVGLETRVPFLDKDLVSFAWRLSGENKIYNGQGKYILRQLLRQYVPSHLIERPKTGFGVPIGFWLRGPLRGWAEELLDFNNIKNSGHFNPMIVKQLMDEHISGKKDWSSCLWSILMFQSWLKLQKL